MSKNIKSWFGSHKVLTVIAVIVVLVIIGGAVGGGKSNKTTSNKTTSSEIASNSSPGASDNSTSSVTDVCSVVTNKDVSAAFGGTYRAGGESTDPLHSGPANLSCQFSATGPGSVDPTGAVEVSLRPQYYEESGMSSGIGTKVDGLGTQAMLLGNTLFIKRGADVIEIITLPFNATPEAQAAMTTLGKAIYSKF